MAHDEAGERIFNGWHEATKAGDLEGMLELYTDDAIVESPLVVAVMGVDSGVCEGKQQIREFFEGTLRVLADRSGPVESVRFYRTGEYFCNGRTLIWEYPRETPHGDQSNIVEVMELEDGLIRHHKIYWGWVGVADLLRNAAAAN